MPVLNVNFGDAENFEVLPAGKYPVVVDSVVVKQSANSEFPYLNFTLKITEGEAENRNLFLIGSLSPKALWRLQAYCEALGVDLPVGADGKPTLAVDFDEESGIVMSPDFVGRAGTAIVKIEKYEGRDQNRVEDLQSIDDAPGVITKTPAPATGTKAPAPRVRNLR